MVLRLLREEYRGPPATVSPQVSGSREERKANVNGGTQSVTESGFSFTDSKWQAAGTARAPSRTLGSVAQVGRVPCPKGQGRPPSPPNPFIRASDRQASSPGRTTNSWRRPDPLLSLRAAKSTATKLATE